MIRKSGYRFSEKIVLKQKLERDDDSKKSHPALGRGEIVGKDEVRRRSPDCLTR
jgi:hypothetical protein